MDFDGSAEDVVRHCAMRSFRDEPVRFGGHGRVSYIQNNDTARPQTDLGDFGDRSGSARARDDIKQSNGAWRGSKRPRDPVNRLANSIAFR